MTVSTMPILIVDDYNTMIRILRNLLRQLGFTNIDEASDGRTALAKMQSKNYAFVISDWSMSSMSGIELMKHAQANAKTAETPFVMLANDNDEGEAEQRAGARSYLVKPFTAQALKDRLVPVIGAF